MKTTAKKIRTIRHQALPFWKKASFFGKRAAGIARVLFAVPVIAAGVVPVQPLSHSPAWVSSAGVTLEKSAVPTIRFARADFTPQIAYSRSQARDVTVRERPPQAEITPEPSFEQKRALVQQAAAHYGIDWPPLEAVWEVESGKSWDTQITSYAGAQGPWQFMRGTWRAHAFVDGNGDGVIAITSAADGAFAAAHLLANSGADRGDWDAALFSYNHSRAYVQKVKSIAESIK
jgi:hypothetical protein